MAKDLHSQDFDEATLTKLGIFEDYLKAWIGVFTYQRFWPRLAIWDFFAGVGHDTSSTPGSPLRIIGQIEAQAEAIIKERKQFQLLFNDSNLKKAERLRTVINERTSQWSLRSNVSIQCTCESFQDLFSKRLDELKIQPNLILLDQYGVSEVSDRIFTSLIQLKQTDFLFFVSSSWVKRFSKTDEFKRIFPRISGDQVANARYEDVHRLLCNYYQQLVPASNNTRLYPFTIRKNTNIYGLIFGSSHPLAFERFLAVAWSQNQLNGEANFDIDGDVSKSQLQLFGPQKLKKLEAFDHDLETYINEQKLVTNRDVYEFTLGRGHPPSHATSLLRRMKRDGKIECSRGFEINFKACLSKTPKIVQIKAVNHG